MPLVRIRDLKTGSGTVVNYFGDYDSQYIVEPGNLLIGMDGEFRCHEWQGKRGLLNQRVCKLVNFSEDLLPRFIYFGINKYLKEIEDRTSFTTVKHLSSKTIKSISFPVPPLEEQRQIVAVLDEAFKGLDRARAHAETNLRDTNELFDSFLSAVFCADAQNWPTVTLLEIAENMDRVRVPITKKDRMPGDVRYYGASGVVDHVADFLFNEDLLLVSEDGANLLARSYPIAFSISGKSWVNNHAHVLRFQDSVTQEYIRLYLNSISVAPYVRGMAQPKLNQSSLNRIPIPFPSKSGRAEIVGHADLISAETEQLAEEYQASLKGLDDLRQALLQRAFAGELT